jgi:hypothetical protein
MDEMERWERRARKLAKRREGMRVTGASLKKVLLPLLSKKAEQSGKAGSKKRAKSSGKR